MKKKILSLCLVIALAAVAIIGGTMAYFTDTDAADNVFTAGGVKIELIEQKRTDVTAAMGEDNPLVPFKNDQVLMPLAGSVQSSPHTTYGLPMGLENYQDKIVSVKNSGQSSAYVRVYILVPAALEAAEAAQGNFTYSALHVNYSRDPDNYSSKAAYGWEEEVNTFGKIMLDGVEYNVYYRQATDPVEAGTTTEPAYIGCYLDNNVNMKDDGTYTFTRDGVTTNIGYDFSKGVKILVKGVAVQSAGFADADTAFNTAFGSMVSFPWLLGE